MEIHEDSGYLIASQQIGTMIEAAATDNITDAVKWTRYYSKASKVFGLGAAGRLYFYASLTTNRWHLLHADANTCNGGGMEEFNNKLYWASDTHLGRTEDTTLVATINSSTLDIKVVDTTDFPSSGDLLIEEEAITYTGKSGTTNGYLTGCTRGARSTTAASHTSTKNIFGFTDSHQVFTADDNKWHPMKVFNAKLNIGDGRYIATLDSADIWNATTLTMPDGYRTRCLAIFNNLLNIGTWQGTTFGDIQEAALFTWNGIDELPTQAITNNEAGIDALFSWQNTLIVFAGVRGKVFQFNGSQLIPWKQVSKLDVQGTNGGEVYPDSVGTDIDGNLLFGFSRGTKSAAGWYGLYKIGRKNISQPIALTGAYTCSTGTNRDFYSIYKDAGGGNIYFSWYDGANYGFDSRSRQAKNPSTSYMETQTYNISKNSQPRILKGVELTAKPMASNTGSTIKFKLDNAASWTSLGQITLSNQDDMLKGINERAKTIQLKLEYLCSGNNSPEVSQIKIY